MPFLAAGVAPPFLAEIAALIVAGAVIAYVCYRLGLVPIIGFLLAGVVIGPHALGLVRNQALVDAAAEVGVILLLFTIGIEFSLERLARIKKLIFGGGTLQVGLATLATMGILVALGVGWRAGLFTGFLVALSSTAIVLKLMADRGETNSEPGQVSMGLLIFQDLAVIVMVLLVPMLGEGGGGSAANIGIALGTAALLIIAVLVVARRLMPKLLEAIARTCSPELFLLSVIAICFGTAYLTSLAGVSVSLGAFLAGLVVSESRFSQHAFGEILPLQILFSATFFISVGMLLDVGFLLDNLLLVVAIVAVVLVLKGITTAASVRLLGYELPVAAASGVLLAQVGEFSFVLERTGRALGLTPAGLGEAGSQAFIAATVLLMILTPFLARTAMKVAGVRHLQDAAPAHEVTDEVPEQHEVDLSGHVIIAGYGNAARRIVPALAEAGVPYVIATLSPWGATEAEEKGFGPVIRGDYARRHTLTLAGILRARMVVIADDDPVQAHRVAEVVRGTNPEVRVLVRTRSEADTDRLGDAGADRVVSDEAASADAVVEDILETYGGIEPVPSTPIPELTAAGADTFSADVSAAWDQRRFGLDIPSRSPSTNPEDPGMMTRVDTERPVELHPRTTTTCTHQDQVRTVYPSARGCEECLEAGDTWVHLRICMTCGHVGCCDSSKNKHARKHHHRTGHPIIRSLEPGETWGYCFEDNVML